MDNYKTITITGYHVFKVRNWNTIKDIIEIISNKKLGITFDTPPNNISFFDKQKGLNDRFEGLATEIFYEGRVEYKGLKFQTRFFYSGVCMNRRQYFNNIMIDNKMRRQFEVKQVTQ